MMRKKILFALGVVVLIMTLFGLCGMLRAGMMLPGDNGKTSFGIYPAVPYPVVGLLLAFGLFALGAVKKGVHPLTVLPAFAASALWLCLSGTPVFSVTYKLTDPQILPSALMLLGLTGSLCALGLFAEKTAPFDLKQMLILLAIVPVLWALSRAEAWANEMRQLSQPSMLDLRQPGAQTIPRLYTALEALLLLLSGAALLPLIERGRKAAGVALLSIGIVSGVWFLLCQFSTPFIAWASAAVPRLLASHSDVRVLSFTAALLFSGGKCLLTPRKA